MSAEHSKHCICLECTAKEAAANANEQSELASARGSLSDFGSEILIAQREARAAQCEQTAEQFRAVTTGLISSHLEKARAFRKCIEDLRRQMGHESKRQPTENAGTHAQRKESL